MNVFWVNPVQFTFTQQVAHTTLYSFVALVLVVLAKKLQRPACLVKVANTAQSREQLIARSVVKTSSVGLVVIAAMSVRRVRSAKTAYSKVPKNLIGAAPSQTPALVDQ